VVTDSPDGVLTVLAGRRAFSFDETLVSQLVFIPHGQARLINLSSVPLEGSPSDDQTGPPPPPICQQPDWSRLTPAQQQALMTIIGSLGD
jgi:hypothetical protein